MSAAEDKVIARELILNACRAYATNESTYTNGEVKQAIRSLLLRVEGLIDGRESDRAEIARLRADIDRHAEQRAHWSSIVGKNAGIHDELVTTKIALARASDLLRTCNLLGPSEEWVGARDLVLVDPTSVSALAEWRKLSAERDEARAKLVKAEEALVAVGRKIDTMLADPTYAAVQRRRCPACSLLYADAADAVLARFSEGEHLCWVRDAECKAAVVSTPKVVARRGS